MEKNKELSPSYTEAGGSSPFDKSNNSYAPPQDNGYNPTYNPNASGQLQPVPELPPSYIEVGGSSPFDQSNNSYAPSQGNGYNLTYNPNASGQLQPVHGQQPLYGGMQQYPNVVVHQPAPATCRYPTPPPKDYLAAAIAVTILCFWPIGCIAIMRANEANDARNRGDLGLAHRSATSAKHMILTSILVGCAMFAAIGIFVGIYVTYVVPLYQNPYD